MLTLEINLDLLGSPWQRTPDGLCGPAGRLIPLNHPMVDVRVTTESGKWQVDLREKFGGAESLVVQGSGSRIRISAGTGGVCPLYITLDGPILRGTWNPADLMRSVSPLRLVDRAVTRLLTRRQRYSVETMFEGLYKVTERSVVTVDRAQISFTYPEPADHVLRARELRPTSDPVRAFDDLLSTRFAPFADADRLGQAVEVSGGLDSATVATAAARVPRSNSLASVGLLVGGKVGSHQEARRSTIVGHLELRDFTCLARATPPFEPGGARSADRVHYADGDVYIEAFDGLRRHLRAGGVQVVFTGFGGDELMALRGSERRGGRPIRPPRLPLWLGERALKAADDLDTNIAPASATAVSALMVFAARNPSYISHGLWPVAPLADATLLRLCESLPVFWRSKKTLIRSHLQVQGLPAHVTHPRTVESFRSTMDLAMRQNGRVMLEQMLDDSQLVDQGYVDRRSLARVHATVSAGARIPHLLYDTLAVERSLQSLIAVAGRNNASR